jgi:replicative DNA helicase
LEQLGGPSAITSLINEVPTSVNVEHYAHIVERHAILRGLLRAAGEIAALAYEQEDANVALELAEQRIFALGQRGRRRADFLSMSTVMQHTMSGLDRLQRERGTFTGISTGLRDLDLPLGGLQRSDLLILAARPGTGKTALALHIATQVVYEQHGHAAFFSLEMGIDQLGTRLLAMHCGIHQQRLRTGWVRDEEWERVIHAMNRLAEGTLWLDDTGTMTVATLRSKARRLHAQVPLDLIVVDYLQLLHATIEGKRIAHREQEIATVSRELKALAKELNVPVLALAQLSRAVENRPSRVPQLSDLRESGGIENDADVVLFLSRDELSNRETERQGIADLIIAKHRNGPTGEISLRVDAPHNRFSTW